MVNISDPLLFKNFTGLRKVLALGKKQNDKKLEVKFQQRAVTLKCPIDKGTILLHFLPLFTSNLHPLN